MKNSERIIVVVCLALAVIGVGMVYAWPNSSDQSTALESKPPARTGEIPPPLDLRELPVQISGWGGFEDAVSDEALYFALDTSIPYSDPPSIAQLLHEMRLWGLDSPFPVVNERIGRSGDWTMSVLLDDAKCLQQVHFADSFDGFLLKTRYGIRVLTAADPGMGSPFAQGHYGQMLQGLAEIGAPLSTPVTPDVGEPGTLADLLADSAARYSVKDEPEFLAVAFASWLKPGAKWMDRFGGEHTMDDLAQRLAKTPIGAGTCYGGHLPYAITMVLRVNQQERIISEQTERDLIHQLKEFSRVLTRSQQENGTWDYDWSGIAMPRPDIYVSESQRVDLITCTGHHLEWIALASPEWRPDDEVVRKAIDGLAELVLNLPTKKEQSFKDMLPSSHAARALCLLRNQAPFPFWEQQFAQRNPEAQIEPHRNPAPIGR